MRDVSNIFYYASMTILLIAAFLMIYTSYLLFAPVKVIEPNVQPYKVVESEAKAGEEVTYTVDYCKYIDAPGTITRQLIAEGVAVNSQEQAVFLPSGCPLRKDIKVKLPLDLASGEYYIRINLEYRVNAVRTVEYEFITESFHVTNPLEEIVEEQL